MDGLMIHGTGSRYVTYDELKKVETPEWTSTWHPVPHAEVADLIREKAEVSGFKPVRITYGLNPLATKMFGVMKLEATDKPDYTRAIGFRNSHDKSMAVGLTSGINVFVCDNMAFSGETTVEHKHTSGLTLGDLVERAFSKMNYGFERLDRNVIEMKAIPVGDDDARAWIMKAAEEGAINVSDSIKVLQLFLQPPHPDFQDRNKWSLLNAITEHVKTYSPARQAESQRLLAPLFSLA